MKRITDLLDTILWTAVALFAHLSARGRAADDESGADLDANVRHCCMRCGRSISGPRAGRPVRDVECWDCHCAGYVADDDNPAVPSYVQRPI